LQVDLRWIVRRGEPAVAIGLIRLGAIGEKGRGLRIPVHVIGGAADLLSGRAPVEALAGVFRNGSVEMIEASGHYPWVDQPEAFARAVRRWSSVQADG
jgi:pimeloyl-ACP methyl ester carboxylesterase